MSEEIKFCIILSEDLREKPNIRMLGVYKNKKGFMIKPDEESISLSKKSLERMITIVFKDKKKIMIIKKITK